MSSLMKAVSSLDDHQCLWSLQHMNFRLKVTESSPSYPPCYSYVTSIGCQSAFSLQHETLYPGKVLPGTEGQKATETLETDSWSVVLSEKDLDQKGEMKKINKQKPQLNRVGRPEGRALMPCDDSIAQQEKERLLSFPGKDSANEKPWTLCLL